MFVCFVRFCCCFALPTRYNCKGKKRKRKRKRGRDKEREGGREGGREREREKEKYLVIHIVDVVGEVNSLQTLHLFEVALAIRGAPVVRQGEGVAQSDSVGDVDVTPRRCLTDVIDVQEDRIFGRVQDRVGML